MFLNLDKKRKSKEAVIDDTGMKITYGDIVDIAKEMGSYIESRSVVFVLNNNSVSSTVGYLSCMINKAVPLMLSASLDSELLEELEKLYTPAFLWEPSEMVSTHKSLFSYGTYSLVRTGESVYPIYDELSLLLTTSGSTGSPKLVRHTYCNLESQGKNISLFFGLTEEDRPMIDLPINYTFGLSVLNSHLYSGATCLITGLSVLEQEYWDFFKRNSATSITGVPYTFEILKKIKFFRMDIPSLNLISQGGGRLSDELFVEIAEYAQNTGRRFIATYGQTEGSARMAYLPAEEALRKKGSIGKAIPGGKLYVVDDDGKKIAAMDTTGEMVYEGPNVTMGYAQCKEDLLKGDERKGILYTGDIVKRDEEGFFYVIGRKKRFLKLNGYRVGLDECEKLIKEKFEIECACVGSDKEMVIYIVGDVTEKEIKTYIAQKTGINSSFFKVIKTDCLPRNEAGKILYSAL